MLTLFAMPKPFKGHFGIIQRNAIGSWTRLHPSCEILIFGDEEGTQQATKDLNVRHIPEVVRNEYGTPLLNDLFKKTEQSASHDLFCYVNCDILLMDDFIQAVDKVSHWRNRFLMVGECWNLDLTEPEAFEHRGWQSRVRTLVLEKGKSRGPWYIDYFVFSRGLYEHLPPFAVGRAGLDNWLIWKARDLKADVVDASHFVTAVHQDHDYSHVAGGGNWSYHGNEARQNLELAGGKKHYYLILDATHRLDAKGLRRNFGAYLRLKFRWRFHIGPRVWRAVWNIAEITRPIRHPLGLHMTNVKWFKSCLSRQK
ncbi:MAG: hypothetical protein O7C75_17805 [Verrucomicrobia bacterium]|nr:hypothetical protein [Verrucomicrobiota bacterium]